jgi:hypothetical protein
MDHMFCRLNVIDLPLVIQIIYLLCNLWFTRARIFCLSFLSNYIFQNVFFLVSVVNFLKKLCLITIVIEVTSRVISSTYLFEMHRRHLYIAFNAKKNVESRRRGTWLMQGPIRKGKMAMY